MTTSLIIGSGPAAAGVTLALTQQPRQQVTVLDIGGTLDQGRRDVVERLSSSPISGWDPDDVAEISAQPVATSKDELPQKRSYGSDYPFRDLGQVTGVASAPGANRDVISSAYGGFSNVWGAQVMPFSRSTFDRWPIAWEEIEPHYKSVLGEVPLAAEEDDYADLFPLLGAAQALPEPAPRTAEVLRRYERHRAAVRERGVVVGRARLAFHARDCVRCGLCMTGCPYSLIYSAAQTFDKLRQKEQVTYRPGLHVVEVGQRGSQAYARARELSTGTMHEFTADRLYLAAGGLGTTRLVLGSLAAPPPMVDLGESVQFMVPFLSRVPVQDPRSRGDWTLNQFNMLLDFGDTGYDTSQVHVYPYNPAFFEALPGPLQARIAGPATAQVLRRISVGLGYLPSWASPRVRVTHRRVAGQDLPALTIDASQPDGPTLEYYRNVMRRLLAVAPKLDLWPAVPVARMAGGAKSYHFGGSFPHARPGAGSDRLTTDRWGRLPEWDRVHLVDGSVFPSVPSTTFTLTVMANAHRIASEVLTGQGVLDD